MLGPIIALKPKAPPIAFSHRIVAELWFYPDDSRILELSTKCPPDDAFKAAAETGWFAQRGIESTASRRRRPAGRSTSTRPGSRPAAERPRRSPTRACRTRSARATADLLVVVEHGVGIATTPARSRQLAAELDPVAVDDGR